MKKGFAAAAIIVMLAGCASNLPMTAGINDFVMLGVKTNTKDTVSFEYTSDITDGQIIPVDASGDKIPSHPGFVHTEPATLQRMLNEYFSLRFGHVSPAAQSKIRVSLKKFELSQYSTDSSGKAFLAVMAGGEINTICAAKSMIQLEVDHNGQTLHKVIVASAEDTFVTGFSTGTSTSNFNRGKDSIEHVHARNINKMNNKALMLMNSYFEEIGI